MSNLKVQHLRIDLGKGQCLEVNYLNLNLNLNLHFTIWIFSQLASPCGKGFFCRHIFKNLANRFHQLVRFERFWDKQGSP
jgi:hypothetical protein